MGVTNRVIYFMAAVCLMSSGSLSQDESPTVEPDKTTVTTTTLTWVPSPPFPPHNDSHGVSGGDSKETDDANYPEGDDYLNHADDSPTAGGDDKYPPLWKDPQYCHLDDDPAWLCNKNYVLEAETANGLSKLLESLVEASEICPCRDVSCQYTGFPMVVFVLDTIPDYQNKSHKDKEEHVHKLASSILRNWTSNSCENGAVTVVVASDRIVVTVIGQASKSRVSDACHEFVENATSSFFQEGHIKEGLTNLIEQYRLIVLTSHSCNSDARLKTSIIIPIIIVIALMIVAAVVAGVILIYRRRGSKDISTEANVPLKDQQQPEKA